MSEHLERACKLHREQHEQIAELARARAREREQEATSVAIAAQAQEAVGAPTAPPTGR